MVYLSPERFNELNDHLMLFYTGIKRTASDIAASYVPDIALRERELYKIIAMVDEGISILDSGQPIFRFGELLHEAWQAKSNMSPQVSNSRVDEIYDAARAAGAVGGKLLGAGGGGFMLLFAHPSQQAKIREALQTLIQVPFKFETSGSQIIFFDAEEDYFAEEMYRANQPAALFQELATRNS